MMAGHEILVGRTWKQNYLEIILERKFIQALVYNVVIRLLFIRLHYITVSNLCLMQQNQSAHDSKINIKLYESC